MEKSANYGKFHHCILASINFPTNKKLKMPYYKMDFGLLCVTIGGIFIITITIIIRNFRDFRKSESIKSMKNRYTELRQEFAKSKYTLWNTWTWSPAACRPLIRAINLAEMSMSYDGEVHQMQRMCEQDIASREYGHYSEHLLLGEKSPFAMEHPEMYDVYIDQISEVYAYLRTCGHWP